ncbi:hypothetical protein HYV50_04535 [Candidatus Pacearchaeota archaeon]|nr:hypothetical protein [Candidatus Pacearchaeota archaeon]
MNDNIDLFMKCFRNVLAHRDGSVNHQTEFENIKNGSNDFNSFLQEIDNFLKKQKE